MAHPDAGTEVGKGAPSETSDPRDEVRLVTERMFDWLFPVALVLGGSTLAVAIWRTLEFDAPGVIALYAAFFAALVIALGLRRRLPWWVVSAVLCAVGMADGLVAVFIYGFASAGLLLLSTSTLCAGIFFGLRGGLFALGIGLSVLVGAAWGMCSGTVPIQFDPAAYLRAPAGWTVQIVHYAFLSLFGVVMVHALRSRQLSSFHILQQRTRELLEANRTLEIEADARKRAEGELSESERLHTLVLRHVNDVIAIQDMGLRIQYVSPSAEKMFGYTPEEATELTIDRIMTADSWARASAAFGQYVDRARTEDVAVPLAEYEYLRKDGSTFSGELSATFLRDEHHQLTGTVALVRDVSDRHRARTEQERLQDQLRQSDKLRVLGQLAGGIAHDFNNQLAGIMGYAEMLSGESAGQGFVGEASGVILQCARRAGELTSKLLAFARKGTYRVVPVDAHEIVREVAAILERSIDKSVALRLDLSAPHSVVMGDPTQLQTALLNLGINARDAMSHGGEIVFASTIAAPERVAAAGAEIPLASERYLELSVRDTGIGMDTQTLERIFEPFFTTKRSGAGTGLGLSAVHGTAIAHHGAVAVESQPGVGTTFRLFLPVSLDLPASASGRPRVDVRGSGRLLVIDDEPAVRRLVHEHLTRKGYDVVTAGDGAEAVAAFQRGKGTFDLVILDLVLPGMDGPSVYAALASLDPEVKVLLVSGHDEDSTVNELMRRGALDILRKPFTLDDLSARVAAASRSGRALSEPTEAS